MSYETASAQLFFTSESVAGIDPAPAYRACIGAFEKAFPQTAIKSMQHSITSIKIGKQSGLLVALHIFHIPL